jgi:hypothetical protein
MRQILKRVPDEVLVFVVFFLFFVCNLTANFSGPHDSLGYLNDLERKRDLFPAAHLFYHWLAYLWLGFWERVLPHVQHFYLVETFDTVWGCLALAMVYRIFVRRMQMDRIRAFFGTAVAALSFGVWFYSSNIEVYMPSLFCLMWGLYVCTREQWTNRDLTQIIFIHILAVLFHQANVLFGVVVLWKLWDSRKTLPLIPSLVRYGGLSVLITAGIYFVFGWWVADNGNLKDFNTWLRGDTVYGSYWFPLSAGTFFHALVGLGHAFFGAHFIFRIGFLQRLMNRVFYYHNLDDEAFLVRNLSSGMAALLAMLAGVVCIVMGFFLVRIISLWKSLYRAYRRTMMPLLLFLLTYSTFFYFWMPDNLEFWIPQTVVIWLFLLGLGHLSYRLPGVSSEKAAIQGRADIPRKAVAGGRGRKLTLVFAGLALLLFIVNYWGSIRWMKDLRNDIVYEKTKVFYGRATARDVIVMEDPWLISYFLEQYTPSVLVAVPAGKENVAQADRKIDSCLRQGGQVYLLTEGKTVHALGGGRYIDSLLSAHASKVMDVHNELTPVKMIVNP